ncbi:competence protein ComEC [Clavibacter michiganensis]|uniref:ComEC/Rec2 family competence protein n=1 Tax=Clavibacter michiganensis TaxID=28447 RepID=UPI0019585A3C|nr:competence protein ComEC [Clavibacter michiganensis]
MSDVVLTQQLNTSDVSVAILDVGHGSCVVVQTEVATILIDTGANSSVLEYLEARDIQLIDLVIISHADQDHVGGLSAMLSSGFPVRRVVWNTDGLKRTKLFQDLSYQLDDLADSGSIIAHEEVGKGLLVTNIGPRVKLEILAPRLRLRRLGVGNRDRTGAAIKTNSVSAVVRVSVDDMPLMLVPGDLDAVGLRHMKNPELPDMRAKYLVLPHHGGTMASSAAGTATALAELVAAVQPELVLISNGRSTGMDNPRPEVLQAALSAMPNVAVACTQLSRSCSPSPVGRTGSSDGYAAGWQEGHSCLGSAIISGPVGGPLFLDRTAHEAFLDEFVPGARCRLASRELERPGG